MRSGGSNLTRKHMEDISLSGLFLMEVTKTIDRQFVVHHSTSHTTRDAQSDINKIASLLTDGKVTSSDKERNSPSFNDPAVIGLDKLANTNWLKDTLNRTEQCEENNIERESNQGLVDINYELMHVL